ncbi:MAG TPA: penicillin-binding protein 2 [Chromatiaceae bacterium]|nr:penicillin-binding protein 2 [Chromatiaceae bacterium]
MAARREKRAKMHKRAEALPKAYVGRRRVVLTILMVAVSGLIWRAVDQQIFERDFLQSEGDHRYLDQVRVPAHRGAITDRNGAVLAMSTPVDSIAANPRLLRPNADTLQPLAKALDIGLDDLRRRLARYSHKHFVYLKRRLPPEEAQAVMDVAKENHIVGLQTTREYRRYYPDGEIFAHVIGFTNLDDIGQEGLEYAFNEQLAGKPGLKRVLRDGRRQVVADVESLRMPQPGKNLALGLDQRLQYIAYRELKAAIKKHNAISGSIVMLDVKTGEILAMVNQPGFNPNSSRSARGGRLRNRAVTDVFEPGSTMKPLTVAVGLDLGVIEADTRIDTNPGFFKLGKFRVKDHDNLGVVDIETIIKKSSNVGAGKIALSLPKERFRDYLVAMGFGKKTGSGYPGEASGQLRPATNWARIDQATLSYGYGISVSVLQLAQAYAVIAADGVHRPVSLLRRDAIPEGKRIFSRKTAMEVRHMMESVVAPGGTATKAAVAGYRVAGKTGTVKKAGKGGYTQRKYLSLFAGMAPASDPRLVVAVMINEPRGKQYYGGLVAAPVFSAVMDDALRLLNVAPDALAHNQTVRLAHAEAKP